MKIFGREFSFGTKATQTMSLDTLLRRLEAEFATAANIAVTPDTAMQSPTVLAIVTAISRRLSILPVKVYRRTKINGRMRKEEQPDHPIAKLLAVPNEINDRVNFWLDAASWFIRYGNFYAHLARGRTGPVRILTPFPPANVDPRQNQESGSIIYRVAMSSGELQEFAPRDIMHARGPSRNGIKGDSPISDIREAIALDIAAERMGAAVFGNSAAPGLVFQFAASHGGFKTDEERDKFQTLIQSIYAKSGRFKSLVLPKGVELGQQVSIDNEKAQFLATRQYQRTVIAGAFGVPPHMVGDLTKGTYSNVEQQSLDFSVAVILPVARAFEAAMERSLLTPEDRNAGIIIRFNLDATLRGSFKERQEGLKIQRESGVINPNDWREMENMNPISEEDGGEGYWMQGPSGQQPSGVAETPPTTEPPGNPTEDPSANPQT